jgi:hypothetical protein
MLSGTTGTFSAGIQAQMLGVTGSATVGGVLSGTTSTFSAGIQAQMLGVTGSATVGGVLSGTTGTFSAGIQAQALRVAGAASVGGILNGTSSIFSGNIQANSLGVTGNAVFGKRLGVYGLPLDNNSISLNTYNEFGWRVYPGVSGGIVLNAAPDGSTDTSKPSILTVRAPTTTKNAITFDTTNQRIGIFNTNPAYTVDIQGDLRVSGVIYSNPIYPTVQII